MKKIVSLILSIMLCLQIGTVANAFYDTVNSPFNNKKYNHDDKFQDYEILHGLDLSIYQRGADFAKIKAAGADFVILRAAYRGYGSAGNLVKDTCFEQFAKSAIEQGLDVGAYIYSQAITKAEARQEADYILNIVKDYNITMPIVLDYEYAGNYGRLYNANLTKSKKTAICNAFCEQVENNGYTAMVYANQSMLTNDLNDDNIAKNYDIWLANYSTSPKYSGKLYDCDYTVWQYTSTGKSDGVSGNVDCNFRYYKAPEKVTGLTYDETLEKNTLSWNKIKGVYGYEVYRQDNTSGNYTKIATLRGASTTSYTDTEAYGKPTSYMIRAISPYKGTLVGGSYSDIVTTTGVFLITVKSTTAVSTSIEWVKYENAVGYEVLRSTSVNGEFVTVGTTDKDTTTFTDNTNDGFKTYYYKIKAIFDDTSEVENIPEYSVVKEVKKQQTSDFNAVLKTNTSATLNWTTLGGANGIEIWRKAGNKSYKLIKTVNNAKTVSFTNKKLTKGTVYKYKIRQFAVKDGIKYYSSFSSVKTVKPMKKATITLKAYKNKVKITAKKVNGATGYEYYIKIGKKYTLIKTSTKRSFTKKKLSRYTGYSFKVRAYKKVNGKKIYAPFSKVKSVKTK